MKSLARAVGFASCCLVATASLANAGEVALSNVDLDRVTAGNLLFTPNPAFGPVGSQVSPGLLAPVPAPPPITPPPTTPVVPNTITVSDQGATASIRIPTVPSGGIVNVTLAVDNSGPSSTASTSVQGNIVGGTNSQFSGGGSQSTVFR